jgi:eukaryotic-like serine/threonine-protein kinase
MSEEYSARPGMGAHEPISLGGVVGDTYRVTRLLGRGGMGAVWAAEHVRLPGRQVAVKVLLSPGVAEGEPFARFRREAEIASRLGHPNIVQVLDFNTLPAGEPYIVLELLEGETLAQRLQRGPMELDEALTVARQVGSALQAAHRVGVVHRDLKPDNVFLCAPRDETSGVQAKVLDFGISKIRGSQTVATQDAVLMGTPQYMAPEQALGKNTAIDARTDVFALGAIAYEMLGGRPAFAGSSLAEVVYKVVHAQPQPLALLRAGLPLPILSAVDRALQKDPAHRPADVSSFIAELTGRPLTVPTAGRSVSGLDATVASPSRPVAIASAATDPTFTPATPVPVPPGGRATEPIAGGTPAVPWATPRSAARGPSPWPPVESGGPVPVAPLVLSPPAAVVGPAPAALAKPPRRRAGRWLITVLAILAALGVFRGAVRTGLEHRDARRAQERTPPTPPEAAPAIPAIPPIPAVPAVPGLPPEARDRINEKIEEARQNIREALRDKAAEQADEAKQAAEEAKQAAAEAKRSRAERRAAAAAPPDVQQLLADAEEALDDEDPKLALRLADQSFYTRKTSEGWAVKARAFCQLKDLGNARAALGNVTSKADRARVLADCKEHAVELR